MTQDILFSYMKFDAAHSRIENGNSIIAINSLSISFLMEASGELFLRFYMSQSAWPYFSSVGKYDAARCLSDVISCRILVNYSLKSKEKYYQMPFKGGESPKYFLCSLCDGNELNYQILKAVCESYKFLGNVRRSSDKSWEEGVDLYANPKPRKGRQDTQKVNKISSKDTLPLTKSILPKLKTGASLIESIGGSTTASRKFFISGREFSLFFDQIQRYHPRRILL